jgi:cytochrome c-type protein NapB
MIKRLLLLSISAATLLMAADVIDDSELSFREDITDELKLELADIDYSASAPGESTRFDRSFENAPPMIPHDLEGLLPITLELNMCLTCHLPEYAVDVNSTALPESHFVDFRTGKKHSFDDLQPARYNCDQCHVPQANVDPLVQNKFDAAFRDENSKHKSNLLEVINQGIKK